MKDELLNILTPSQCLSQDELLAYMAGKLDAKEAHRVEAHLADCSFCQDALEGLAMLDNKEEIPKLTGELKQYAKSQLKKPHRPVRRPQNYFIGLVALVLFILLLIICVYYFYFFSIKK